MAEYTLAGFGTLLAGMIVEIEHAKHAALEKAAEIIGEEAKRVLGTHDYNWPPLAPSTIERKATGDSPLLETGEMRDSIKWNADSNEAYVGSDMDRAVYHEMGTSRIPPRPFLSGAASHMEHKVVEEIGGIIYRRIAPP